MNKLELLESDTIKLIRSIPQIAKKPAVLWSTGKDSTTVLYLIKKAFGYIPWPVMHLDTGFKFPEVYDFRDRLRFEWNIPLRVVRNSEAIALGINPDTVGRYQCCTELKTNNLKYEIEHNHYDALILSIRHDEHYARGLEDLLSLRDENGNWQYTARFGGYGVTAPEQEKTAHVRVNPILPWTEAEIWQYVMMKNLPVNPLYFAYEAEDGKFYRFRSLGCSPCTDVTESKAASILQIVNEVYMTPGLERAGRMQDEEGILLRLRAWGYM